jgi:hypothetical protein
MYCNRITVMILCSQPLYPAAASAPPLPSGITDLMLESDGNDILISPHRSTKSYRLTVMKLQSNGHDVTDYSVTVTMLWSHLPPAIAHLPNTHSWCDDMVSQSNGYGVLYIVIERCNQKPTTADKDKGRYNAARSSLPCDQPLIEKC